VAIEASGAKNRSNVFDHDFDVAVVAGDGAPAHGARGLMGQCKRGGRHWG
jgi:hypothetical protein